MLIRPAEPDDAAAVADIYNYYIRTSHATFEIDEIDAAEMGRRIAETVADGYPSLVAVDGTEVMGYAYGRQFWSRYGYRHAIEVAVYIRNGREGQDVGRALYEDLFAGIKAPEYHSIIATISLPNDAGVWLHERFGMTKAARFREVGRKFDRWIDVGYWQLIINH